MALIIGLGAGAGAWLLKWLCALLKRVAFSGTTTEGLNWQFVVWPVVGVVLTALAARYLFRQQVSNACERLTEKLRARKFRLSPNIIWETIGGCALTVGLGASAGTESPIAYGGAAIGTSVGRLFRVDTPTLRLLIACGAGAGIAGIFRSPIGGFFFVLEILRMEMTTVPVMALGISCLTAALTTYVLAGFAPDIVYLSPVTPSPSTYGAVILLGVLTGLYALWYNLSSRHTVRLLGAVRHALMKPVGSGLLLGLAVLLMPGLFGDGYSIMTSLLASRPDAVLSYGLFDTTDSAAPLLSTILGMLAVKGVLVALANNGGGVAGDFSPTLFVGCLGGWLFAFLSNMLCGTHLPPGTFACIGMGAAMAGILQAPLMAIFITVEATQAYTLLLPVTVAALAGFTTARGLPGQLKKLLAK